MTVPVLRFSRDKRGYEHFYLVQPIGRQGRSRSRILYWFRTPPNVKVGRHLFEDDTRRALETRFPDMTFEWDKLLATPIPPPDSSERWRERRRLGRTAKASTRFESDQPGEDEAAEPAVGLGAPGVEPVAARAAVDVPADAPPARAQRRRSRRGRRDRRPTDARRVGANDAAAEATEPQEPVADRGLSDRDD